MSPANYPWIRRRRTDQGRHAWRNPSKTEWCRMIFVLQDCQKVVLGGQALGEDLGRGTEGLPPSGNDS